MTRKCLERNFLCTERSEGEFVKGELEFSYLRCDDRHSGFDFTLRV